MNKALHKLLKNESGFTLMELIVVMMVFLIAIAIANNAFVTILRNSTSLTKSAESNIEGVIGLEVFRHDLEQTGFGLLWSYPTGASIDYSPNEPQGWNNTDVKEPLGSNVVPRAVVARNDRATPNLPATPDYLALKGTTLGLSENSQRWNHVAFNEVPKQWASESENLKNNEYFIALRRNFTESGMVNELVVNGASFSAPYNAAALPAAFSPNDINDIVYLYGVSPGQPQMPFNRADYYVRRPANVPLTCAPNTGTLYKSAINQDGSSTDLPLLDCVADMQIVLGWDFDANGVVETWSSPEGTNLSTSLAGVDSVYISNALKDATTIRNQLKVIKVYVLAQDGLVDRSYSNTRDIVVGGTGEANLTSTHTVAQINNNGWNNYRWRVYRLIVTPKNLVQPTQ